MREPILIDPKSSNEEFLKRHAAPGRIGLVGGATWIDRVICRAERRLNDDKTWSMWSHAFLFQGERADGWHWVIESDLQAVKKHIAFGVQENRISKYYDQNLYGCAAVLDLGLTGEQTSRLISEALELVASRARYSVRELLGTAFALRYPGIRGRQNLLAREQSFYCSALVQHLFGKIGVDLCPGIDSKHGTPEDLVRTDLAREIYVLKRNAASSRIAALRRKIREGISGKK
jgi:hypothetical protein